MWDLRVANPFGRVSLRNLVIFVAAIVATSFAFNLLVSHTTHAADAKWNGTTIVYDGKAYEKELGKDDSNRGGLPDGTVYVYKEAAPGDQPNAVQKAHVIYFAPGSDPGDASKAHYATYDFIPPSTYKNKGGGKEISIEKKADSDEKKTSCVVPGIGWLICPVSSFMSSAMDWMYDILAQFLEVQPVATSTESALFKAWSVMRNIANVAFVIAFLFIIYSQVSSIGLSSYGIKKLLPRLVVAAVLVNISYWICAVAIDISNILGYSMKDLFNALNETIVAAGNDSDISWENVTATVLSGGTLATVGVLAVGSISGAIYALLPILVMLILSALVAIILMAARQAIVIILVIVAPLAFVAYILPNTEKFFDKWKDLFITMLMMFPIFGVLFGGSELAGTAIIQNANSLIMVILGMAVKIAPLAIMPFLIRFGGSLLGRIGGMVNNPNKGLVDRTRNFSNSMAESKRQKNLARPNATLRRNGISWSLQKLDNGRRKREGQQKVHETMADARWENSQAAHKLHAAASRAEMIKNTASSNAEAHVERLKTTDPEMRTLNQNAQAAATRAEMLKNVASTDAEGYAAALKRTNAEMQGLDLQARAGKLKLDTTNTMVETNWEQFKAGDITGVVRPDNLSAGALANFVHSRENFANNVQEMSRDAMLTSMRQDMAKRKQSSNLSDAMLKDKTSRIEGQTLVEYAGGIMGSTGANSALSKAITSERKEFGENVENNKQLMRHFDVSASGKQQLAMGTDLPVSKNGMTFTFSGKDHHAREAAIEEQLKTGSYSEIKEIILESGAKRDPVTKKIIAGTEGRTFPYAGTISREIQPNGIPGKAAFFGSKVIDDIGQGTVLGEEGLRQSIVFHIEGGKLKEDTLSGMDAGALKDLFGVVMDPATPVNDRTTYDNNVRALRKSVEHILETDLLLRNTTKKSRDEMQDFLSRTPNL